MFNIAILLTLIAIGGVGIYITRSRGQSSANNNTMAGIPYWIEPNEDKPCDEKAYRDRAIANAEKLNAKAKGASPFEQIS